MADLVQNNLALEERLDKHGSRLYKLENLNIPQQVSKAVDEIVTDTVDWAMQAPLRARFSDLPTAMEKSLEHDYSNKLPADVDEARGKKGKRRTSRVLGSSQLPPPPPPPSTGTAQQQGNSLMNDHSIPGEQMLRTTGLLHCEQDVLTQADFKGHAYEVVKVFYPDVIHLQFQMEECHKILINQIDWANPKGDQVRIDVSRPLPLDGPLSHVTIQTQFFFKKDLEYLRYGNKGSRPTLLIFKMKAARYLDFGLELLVPEQMWIDDVHDSPSRRREVRTHIRILSVVSIKAYSRYEYDYLSKIVLRRDDFQEYTIAEKDFKNLYRSDFEDLNLLLLQGHLDHLPSSDKHMLSTAVKLWTRNLFSDGTLTLILEALDYIVKEFKIKRLNLGMNKRFWTQKDVTRSKEFIAAIEKRLKTRRIYRNLECFVGGTDFFIERDDIAIPLKRYSFPRSRQSQRDLPRDNPLVSVEILRYDYKRSNVKIRE
ncbi:hypothetical protein Tco_1339037 [Tanacetum coccineum]